MVMFISVVTLPLVMIFPGYVICVINLSLFVIVNYVKNQYKMDHKQM